MDADLGVTLGGSGGTQVVRPCGQLTALTQPTLRRVLTAVLHDHGRAVVDLDRCRLVTTSCVTVFAAVLDICGGWPTARLALCGPDAGMAQALVRRGIAALVPVCRSLSEARSAIERRPSVVRIHTRLACEDHAPDVARRLVRESCPRWEVDAELRQIGELVVSELVDNAVKHARTGSVLTLERNAHGLRIRVRDAAAFPCPTEQCGTGQSGTWGRGLELVTRLTTSWGVERHPMGKTVWAEIVAAPPGANDPQPVTGSVPLPSATAQLWRSGPSLPSRAE